MITLSLLQKFLLSLALGALIGIEREKRKHKEKGKNFTGIRTFMLTTLLGTLTAYISSNYFTYLVGIMLVCFVLVMLAGYILSAYFNNDWE